MTVTIHSLYTYPVKSCAGVPHRTIAVAEAGLAYDRHWVIVDAQGVFMTQRQYPRMVLIRPEPAVDGLWLRAPGQASCFVPLPPKGAPAVPVKIFRADTLGADQGGEAARWLSAFLGIPCRLLHVHARAQRPASPEHVARWLDRHTDWPQPFSAPGQHQFAFADGFPFLVTNLRSLDALNEQLHAGGHPPVDMIRFRPNIVLDGLEAYEEDYLAGFRAARMAFAFVKACARCPIPNVDPATGQTAEEPGRTLARHRQFEQGVLFGLNAIVSVAQSQERLSVGDTFEPEYDF